jgi:hypothetical protein
MNGADTRKNIIILTSGLTGSSVLTGLISQGGYWTGETHRKEDYNTYENKQLIGLNLKIFEQAGYRGNYLTEFPTEAMRRIGSLFGSIDAEPYRKFVAECDEHRPWVWKDPRLWLTIRYWKHLLDLDQCAFLVLTRGYLQCWTSAILRRQIRSYGNSRMYEQSVRDSAIDFLRENGVPYLHVRYEDLIVDPSRTIEELNRYLHTNLTVEDLRRIYHKPLYKKPRSSWFDVAKAVMIYAKNYGERVDAVPARK